MKYDAIIIGFGKGGKTMAGALAGQGKKVALIEKDSKMYGGTCINVGCIPSKSLVRSAHLSDLNGGGFDEKSRRFKAAIAEKVRLTDMLRGKNYAKLADHPNVTVYDGEV
ncbi:Pyridine nucleotide-disulphide oxidoreductase [Eubacterium aggregans]|uniref:Pyridine nucleotide-disulphide oxidoreductase n=1 Tax=Eubacterium aggregans TaxID=81409 RepID=A0A1H3YGQ4_9FIRM|nr:Pyridine nucleotide-disulphide oxidoreductase [Eubacterium aggregans]